MFELILTSFSRFLVFLVPTDVWEFRYFFLIMSRMCSWTRIFVRVSTVYTIYQEVSLLEPEVLQSVWRTEFVTLFVFSGNTSV